jgi:DNA-binding Lrp family transcriptional regulator
MARALKLGNDLIEYRLTKYLETGMIDRFSVVAHPFSVGQWIIKNYVKLESNHKKRTALVHLVKRNQFTYWLAEFHGRFDLLFSYIASSPHDCRRFEEQFKDKSRNSISDYQVVIPTKISRFGKKYLHQSKSRDYVFTSDGPTVTVDAIDVKLISLLYQNARLSLKLLAEQVAVTPATVQSRLVRLEQQGVIMGYRFQLNYAVCGVLFFKLLLQLTDYSKDFRDKLFDFCLEHPNVTCLIDQIGNYAIEIEVEVTTYQELNTFIDTFRERFDYGLSHCETLLIKRDHMHRFPESLC